MSDSPAEFLYTREHEWIKIEDNQGIIGITEHAQRAMGDIVYVELPAVDEEIDAADEFGTIESVKAVSSLFMPLSGKIVEVNADLDAEPELINSDCYDTWLVRMEFTNPDETSNLLSAAEYDDYLNGLDEE